MFNSYCIVFNILLAKRQMWGYFFIFKYIFLFFKKFARSNLRTTTCSAIFASVMLFVLFIQAY